MSKQKQIIDNFIKNKNILPNNLYFGTFGSYSSNELDIFFIEKDNLNNILDPIKLNLTFSKIKLFLEKSINIPYLTFTSHLQKNICNNSRNNIKLHTLYYPSTYFLSKWELPSFIAYLYDKANFIIGTNKIIKEPYNNYRKRQLLNNDTSLLTNELNNYAQISINYYLYHICNHIAFNYDEIFDKISYVIRFTLTEILVEQCESNNNILFWDWDDFISFTINIREYKEIIQTITMVRNKKVKIDSTIIDKLFNFYFNMYNETMVTHNNK